jgi:hypothetical protein
MSKPAIAFIAAALAAAVVTPFAGATKPERIPLPSFEFTVSAAVCGFPVHAESIVNKEVATVFPDGRVIITGALTVKLTNLSEPSKTLVVNVSGPTHISADGTFVATGRWLWGQDPNPLAPEGMLVLTVGNVVAHFGADTTTFTLEQRGGAITDLCPALA